MKVSKDAFSGRVHGHLSVVLIASGKKRGWRKGVEQEKKEEKKEENHKDEEEIAVTKRRIY